MTTALVMAVSIAMLTLTVGATASASARGTTALTVSTASDQTIVVYPNGHDDTKNIQHAFDACLAYGHGCTVQLLAGTYYISSQITVYGFKGSFVGAGQGQTNIVALGNMPSPNPNYNIPCEGYPTCTTTTGAAGGVPWWAALPGPNNPWPALFTFEGGSFAISGMTITDTSSTPTQGWYWPAVDGGFWNTALIAAIEITGLEAVATINYVTIVGAAGDYGGFNMANGVHVEGSMLPSTWSNPEADTIPLTGTFSVTNSVFTNVETGPFANYLIDANVAFCDNTFTAPIASASAPTADFAAMDNSNTNVVFCGNHGTATTGYALGAEQGVYKTNLLPSSVTISNNYFQVTQGADGVILLDLEAVPSLNAVVTGNTIQTDGVGYAALGCTPSYCPMIGVYDLHSVAVSHNTIIGPGPAGVYVTGGPGSVSKNYIAGSELGINVDYGTGFWVTGNIVVNSGMWGIALTDYSSDNQVVQNVVLGSGENDLYQDSTSSGNVWAGNVCETSSPPGLC